MPAIVRRRSAVRSPNDEPRSRAARIGSIRSPCARAPCSIVSYLLTPQPLQPKPKRLHHVGGDRKARDQLLDVRLRGDLDLDGGHGFSVEPANRASVCNLTNRGRLAHALPVRSSGRKASSPAAAIRRCARPGASAARCSCKPPRRGAYAYDEEGRRYIDYVMAYGPLLFGHTHPALIGGIGFAGAPGFVWGSTHVEEVRLAERIRAHLPSMERMRFVTSGTEAMMSAIRVARAFTKRRRVLKFAGNYHGHFDLALLDAGASARRGARRYSRRAYGKTSW